MSKLSQEGSGTSTEHVQPQRQVLVSCVNNARDAETQHYDAKEIIEQIRTDNRLRETVTRIREKFWTVMTSTGNDRKAAKQAIDNEKKRLPATTWSGTFSRRKQDALLQHSGLLCADLDGLGRDRLDETREKLVKSTHLWALFVSPTGDGLKAVFRTSAEGGSHKASFRAVEKHVLELTGQQIDQACSDVSRLCFLSHDPNAYLNAEAIELPVPIEAEPAENVVPPPSVGDETLQARRRIAAELLGNIKWNGDSSGYCTCPGQHLHSTGDGERDCEVYLDAAPSIHCFHESCLGIIAGVKHELRSRIGKADFAGTQSGNNGADLMPADWFNKKFPALSEQFGDAVLIGVKNGSSYVKGIGEDFLAGTLADESSPDAPTIFLPTEQKFYTYAPTDGVYVYQRHPALLTRLSRLLLDCARECTNSVDTSALKFGFRDSKKLGGVLKKAEGLLATPDDFFAANLTEFIPCANGMLRLSDKTLLPFSPAYRRRNKLAVPFDPEARCLLFLDTLMRTALDPEDLELLQRWCGLALIGQNLAQRFLILIGTPGGGKGTFVRVLVGIIGQANVASLRTKLLGDRFELGRFQGKTLLYGADVPENFLNHRGASVLKSLTGGDPMTLEFKGSNESPLVNGQFNAIVTCNSRLTVHLEGDTEAWRRRLAIINYRNAKPERVIADLDQQILTTEPSGVLYWMIEGLDKLRADNWQLHLTTKQQKLVDDLLLEPEGHIIFAREALYPADGQELTVDDCYNAYLQFSGDRGWVTAPRQKFSTLIRDVIARTYGITMRHDLRNGYSLSQQRGWKGIQVNVECQKPLDKDLE